MQHLGRKKFRLLPLLFLLLTGIPGAKAQLIVDTSMTPQQLVQNVLLGPGVQAFNITYTGYPRAIGKFTALNTGLGIDSGIVLTSGSVLANDSVFFNAGPAGPNSSGSDGVANMAPGDPDLDNISSSTTYDAAVLQFDFIAMSDSVKFRYVFGSEEYSDFVNSFNDVFAYFLNGVSVTLAPTNIALIPNTSMAVTINNVNNGNYPTGQWTAGPCTNCSYFVDNPTGLGPLNLQYDGLTTVLTAKYQVQCGETYHIKIAIADAIDHVYDSGVFLEAGSFTVGQVTVATQNTYGGTNDSTLFEGCGQSCLIFRRTGAISMADTVALTIGGSAVNGVDFYPALPNQIIFQPGQDSIVICIQANSDNAAESLENLVVTPVASGPCISTNTNTTVVYISDVSPIDVDLGNDTSLCSANPIVLNAAVSNGVQPYSYLWSTGATTSSITVQPTVTTSYLLTVSDPCGTPVGVDTVTVYLPNAAALSVNATPDLSICTGDPAILSVNVSGGSQPYSYTWQTLSGDSLPQITGNTVMFTPSGNGVYAVLVQEGCGDTRMDTIHITVQDCSVLPPNVFTPNGDGTNDALVFTGLENFPGSALIVYNRWGGKVYESSDYHNDWSDSGLSDGTYFYVLNLSDGNHLTGFVTVLKNK
jgi:gliding motility-associated-like protein